MTDQSKIPLPSGDEGAEDKNKKAKGKSLLERAGNVFDSAGFKPAPMPRTLAETPRHARLTRVHETKADQKGESESVGSKEEQTVYPAPQTPSVIPQPVQFSGTKYPIDRDHLRKQGMIVPDDAVTALQEEFRIVKRKILDAARKSHRSDMPANMATLAQRVLVCSPLPGEGKTFCATNLALSMAGEKDSEVVLVDADFSKPSVLDVLGFKVDSPGLMDALTDHSLNVEDCVVGTDVPGLWILPAGKGSSQDSEHLSSNRAGQVLERLTRGAPSRIVIFDSPPALAASQAAELAKYVGQALLVARADSTGEKALEDALSLLSTCADIKLLLNDIHFSPSGRRFGSYNGYGEK